MTAGSVVRVASYNVHRCKGRDGRRDPARVAAVIRELRADVIALQEIESGAAAQLTALAHATGLTPVAGPTMLDPAGDYGNGLLTGLRVEHERRIDLSVRGREPRGAIEAVVRVAGTPLRIVGTHLGLRAIDRRRQVQALLRALVDADPDDPSAPIVLAGDLNEWLPRTRVRRWLAARFGTFPARSTFPAWRPLLALDQIWVRPAPLLRGVRVHESPLAREASDHLPVVGEIAVG
jgi:endonuclease/exonuclease/phosphatase family metal-dependent hydrolase